jgi:hypothetical protein
LRVTVDDVGKLRREVGKLDAKMDAMANAVRADMWAQFALLMERMPAKAPPAEGASNVPTPPLVPFAAPYVPSEADSAPPVTPIVGVQPATSSGDAVHCAFVFSALIPPLVDSDSGYDGRSDGEYASESEGGDSEEDKCSCPCLCQCGQTLCFPDEYCSRDPSDGPLLLACTECGAAGFFPHGGGWNSSKGVEDNVSDDGRSTSSAFDVMCVQHVDSDACSLVDGNTTGSRDYDSDEGVMEIQRVDSNSSGGSRCSFSEGNASAPDYSDGEFSVCSGYSDGGASVGSNYDG